MPDARYSSNPSRLRTKTSTSKSYVLSKVISIWDIKLISLQDCCGVCGSDVHSITGGWGEIPLPLCVGHEVIGKAVKVGDKVKGVKVGDRVGVGAQISACLECKVCKSDNENYCPKQIGKVQ